MNDFFTDRVLLKGEASKAIYESIKTLPIIDYHCHLDQKAIRDDKRFNDIGELWLGADHYKWRALRMMNVDERFITGNASYHDKFLKYASIMPALCGNPLYYWTHFELKQVFGISSPLNEDTAETIYKKANEELSKLSTRKLLRKFNVCFVATTNDPIESLNDHGEFSNVKVTPTFRPDRLYDFSPSYLEELGKAVGYSLSTLELLQKAIVDRLDYFVSKGCKIADHGFTNFPKSYANEIEARDLYLKRGSLNPTEKDRLFGYLLVFLMKEYKKRNLLAQIHFSVIRNANRLMYERLGADRGFDVIGEENSLYDLILFLNQFLEEQRPTIVLYTLNPESLKAIASISGAFRDVLIGAAWWFNDTLIGIRNNLETISEYALLGTHLGMLTDSRSFSSYSRFDFFRRILATFLGEKVDGGEYPLSDAKILARKISYENIKERFSL